MAGHPLEYTPFPTVNPAGAPAGDFENIHAGPEAFGGDIAAGLQSLGQGVEKAGLEGLDVAKQQATRDAQTQLDQVHSWQSDRVTDAEAKFLSLRGRAASDGLSGFKKEIDDIHQQARGQGGNPYTAQLIDNAGRKLTDIAYAQASRHAAQQKVSWDTTTATDSATSAGNRAAIAASTAPQDVELNAHPGLVLSLDRSDDFARQAAQLKGLDGETEVQKNRGTNIKNIVEQIANDGSPDGLKRATNFFLAQKDRVDAGSRLAIQNYLVKPWTAVTGKAYGDEVMGRPPVQSPPRVVADIPANFVSAIRQTEGFDSRPRWDVKQWTVGYGTRALGPDEKITPEQAEARFNDEIAKAAKIVDSVNPNLDPGTRAALTSLTFNAGEAWTHSGLGDKVRTGDMAGAKELFLQYNHAGGETNDSLSTRRAREASWFGRGDISPAESIRPRIDQGTATLRILDDPELVNRPQVQAAALAQINRIYGAYRLQDSQQSAAFTLKLNGSLAELRDTGQQTNPIEHEEFLNGLGPTKGEAAWQDYQKDVALGADMLSLAGQSPDEIAATYGRYANPTPGDDYGAQVQRRDQLQKAIAQNQKAKEADPAGFVIRRTDAGQATWKEFNDLISDKDATPAMRTVHAEMFASQMLAEQERLGIPREQRTVAPAWFTDPIKDQIAAAATSDDPNARQSVLQTINAQKQLWGSAWPQVAGQIAPPSSAPLVKAIAAGADPAAMERLLGIDPKQKPAAVLKEQNAVKASELNAAVNTEMAPLLSTMVGRQRDRDYADYYSLASELSALYVRDGKDAPTAAHDAFNALIGNRYEFRDTYRIPKDPALNADEIQKGAETMRRDLGRFGVKPPIDNIPGRSDTAPAEDLVKIGRDGVWVTSPRNDGLNLVYGDKWVRGSDGKPLFVPWASLAKTGRDDNAAATAALRNAPVLVQ